MTLLFFMCLVCFITGLIKPDKIVFWKAPNERTKKDVLKYLGTTTAILFVLVGVFNHNSSQSTTTTNNVTNSKSQTETVKKTDENIQKQKDEPKETKKIGWIKENQNWHYYDNNGKAKTGWIEDNNKYYYLSTSGVMQKGWIKDQGKDYYLDNSGIMQTGWKESNGKWYYLNENGTMATNKTVNGYYLGANGEMQEKVVEHQAVTNNKSNNNNNINGAGEEKGETAYLPATGQKYHSRPDCGRMNPNKATKTTVSKAEQQGYGRCSKCW
ncbi:hypothetical protein UT300005_05930 [Clostridium sp. CTA-5]